MCADEENKESRDYWAMGRGCEDEALVARTRMRSGSFTNSEV